MTPEQARKIVGLANNKPKSLSLYYQSEGVFYEVIEGQYDHTFENSDLPPEAMVNVETLDWIRLSETSASNFKLAHFMDAVD